MPMMAVVGVLRKKVLRRMIRNLKLIRFLRGWNRLRHLLRLHRHSLLPWHSTVLRNAVVVGAYVSIREKMVLGVCGSGRKSVD